MKNFQKIQIQVLVRNHLVIRLFDNWKKLIKLNYLSFSLTIDEFNHDYDVVTVSEALTEDAINVNKRTPLIIREKLFNNKQPFNQIDFDDPDDEYQEEVELDVDIEDDNNNYHTDGQHLSMNNSTSTQRVQNYQRLSHSINDLFSNLLQQLEKQKNKDYYEKSNNNLNNHLTSLNDNYQLIIHKF